MRLRIPRLAIRSDWLHYLWPLVVMSVCRVRVLGWFDIQLAILPIRVHYLWPL